MAFLAAPWNVLLVWDSLTILNLTFHVKRCTSNRNQAHTKQSDLLVFNLWGWQIQSTVGSVRSFSKKNETLLYVLFCSWHNQIDNGDAHLLIMICSEDKTIIIARKCLADIVVVTWINFERRNSYWKGLFFFFET